MLIFLENSTVVLCSVRLALCTVLIAQMCLVLENGTAVLILGNFWAVDEHSKCVCTISFQNSRLRCFVANFIADGFTRFLCYFFWAKSAFVLIFTLLECLLPAF